MPCISVVIPTYNRANYLKEAIDSVLVQTFTDYEIIVIDDGSTDKTIDTLNPYINKIKYIYQNNKGVSSARNTGIKHSKGQWVAFLDSDDIWYPQKLEKQLSCVVNNDTIYMHAVNWFVDKLSDTHLLKRCNNIKWPETNCENIVIDPILSIAAGETYMTPTILCHKSCFNRIGYFNENISAGEDEDWISRASLLYKFHFLNDVLANIRYHENQSGSNRESSIINLIKVLELMGNRTIELHPCAYKQVINRLSNKESELANILAEKGLLMKSFSLAIKSFSRNPYKIQRLIKSFLFLFGIKIKKN